MILTAIFTAILVAELLMISPNTFSSWYSKSDICFLTRFYGFHLITYFFCISHVENWLSCLHSIRGWFMAGLSLKITSKNSIESAESTTCSQVNKIKGQVPLVLGVPVSSIWVKITVWLTDHPSISIFDGYWLHDVNSC